jgi:uncharacterized protein (DUF433 family)
LAGITEKEKNVRNDITHGVFAGARLVRLDDAHLCFNWPYVPTFAAVYGNEIFDSAELRRVALDKVFLAASGGLMGIACLRDMTAWKHVLTTCALSGRVVDIDNYVIINLGKACEDVRPRIDLYTEGLSRVEESDTVLGGAAVFKGTRISVTHIGKMIARGIPRDEVMEDYNLSEGDIDFAHLYYRARPTRGRPRNEEIADARASTE